MSIDNLIDHVTRYLYIKTEICIIYAFKCHTLMLNASQYYFHF